MIEVLESGRVIVSPSDTIEDIAANTHYTARELTEIVQGIVDRDQDVDSMGFDVDSDRHCQ